ncbi:hypothetical protein PAHAL_7G151700 [Panicum hallii]|uniref:Uncharacterized protein n=1 Tax=Panicum hallii TaxID=206008 RepID=A0A2T8ICC3_9POAL|nr:hypothetical protein PAHAL_7G151700 [Panicum hallii]
MRAFFGSLPLRALHPGDDRARGASPPSARGRGRRGQSRIREISRERSQKRRRPAMPIPFPSRACLPSPGGCSAPLDLPKTESPTPGRRAPTT